MIPLVTILSVKLFTPTPRKSMLRAIHYRCCERNRSLSHLRMAEIISRAYLRIIRRETFVVERPGRDDSTVPIVPAFDRRGS